LDTSELDACQVGLGRAAAACRRWNATCARGLFQRCWAGGGGSSC